MESTRVLQNATENLLQTLNSVMPKDARQLADVLAGTLKMGMRLKLGRAMPQVDADGVDWIIGVVGEFAGQMLPSLTFEQKSRMCDILFNFAHDLDVALRTEEELLRGGENGLSNLAQ